MSTVVAVGAGVRGFDANATLSAAAAAAFYAQGYRFAVRYLARLSAKATDLSADEIQTLHDAGLAVMAVQHVESESSWTPSGAKGSIYGAYAGNAVRALGLEGTTVWCDLEGVAAGVDPTEYCRNWCTEVRAAGAMPGLYVGWHANLNPTALYALPFIRYWAAYNLNADEYPATVGVCMQQHAAKASDIPDGVTIAFDVDTVCGDRIGRFPAMLAPDGWAP